MTAATEKIIDTAYQRVRPKDGIDPMGLYLDVENNVLEIGQEIIDRYKNKETRKYRDYDTVEELIANEWLEKVSEEHINPIMIYADIFRNERTTTELWKIMGFPMTLEGEIPLNHTHGVLALIEKVRTAARDLKTKQAIPIQFDNE